MRSTERTFFSSLVGFGKKSSFNMRGRIIDTVVPTAAAACICTVVGHSIGSPADRPGRPDTGRHGPTGLNGRSFYSQWIVILQAD